MENTDSGNSAENPEERQGPGNLDSYHSSLFSIVKRRKNFLLLISFLAFWCYPFSTWLFVAPEVFKASIFVGIFATLLIVSHFMSVPAAFLHVLTSIPLVFYKASRPRFMYLVTLSLIVILSPAAGCIATMKWQRDIRMAKMHDFTERMQPLVDAIQEYEKDNGKPPDFLSRLVPDYIPEIPSSGMMSYPRLRYYVQRDAPGCEFLDNKWALCLETPRLMNFDMMVYFPNQNYPENGFSGWLEPVGDWAYVHE